MPELTAAVKQYARELGADLVGVAPVSRYAGAPHRLTPTAHLPEARSVVVMAIHHPDASVEWGGEPNSNFSGPFQIGMIPKLDTIAFRLARFLEERGHATLPISCTYFWRHRAYKDIPYDHAASFSHMNAFVAAGLGEYGWHGMVMSPRYGPRQRIISVITAAELVPDPLYRGEPLCDRCNQCERACYGKNYESRHLLSPSTIAFEIEGKRFEYANVNRWRCFWGEQCHLDMNRLAEEENLTEAGIYEAMDQRGVQRAGIGAAGYMCASFKYCMSRPVRRWDRAASPGPRRKKETRPRTAAEWRAALIEKARAVGADRLAIQPLADFAQMKEAFYPGFRTDQFFESFPWLITLGRSLPDFYAAKDRDELARRNWRPAHDMTMGRMMMGVVDLAREFDDAGLEAMGLWQNEINREAARRAGWADAADETLILRSLVCTAPLAVEVLALANPFADLKPEELPAAASARLPHVDRLGAVPVDRLAFSAGQKLREYLPAGKNLIALAVELPRRVVELAGRQEAECGASYQYANYQATREAFWAAHDLADRLRSEGYQAVPLVDLDPVSADRFSTYVARLSDLRAQAPFAAAAGLGALGRGGMLISPEFGPRQRLAFVVTDAPWPASAPAAEKSPCPADCRACVPACPTGALEPARIVQVQVTSARQYPVFARDENRCQWARCLGMVEGEGTGLLGWKVPGGEVPAVLDQAAREKALAAKDPIQVRCYQNPNHSDTVIERCLQACPLGS